MTATKAGERRTYRYFDFVMVAFVTVLVCSNLIGPAKIAQLEIPGVGPYVFGAGVLFFPISYILGDILTEVYGYARARRVIWTGFAALAFASIMATVVVALPPASFWQHQAAYEVAFGNAWRGRRGLHARLFLRRVRQLVCAGKDEDRAGGTASVDAHDRLDHRRRGGRQRALLPAPLLRHRHHPQRGAADRHARAVRHQDHGRGRLHAADLQDRGLLEARRARGLLRSRYRLQSVHAREMRSSDFGRERPQSGLRVARVGRIERGLAPSAVRRPTASQEESEARMAASSATGSVKSSKLCEVRRYQ